MCGELTFAEGMQLFWAFYGGGFGVTLIVWLASVSISALLRVIRG